MTIRSNIEGTVSFAGFPWVDSVEIRLTRNKIKIIISITDANTGENFLILGRNNENRHSSNILYGFFDQDSKSGWSRAVALGKKTSTIS